jgi:hypothetical protein
MITVLDDKSLSRALNEWMRRYIENPAEFEAEFETVAEFLNEEKQGTEPSYGDTAVAYLRKIDAQLTAPAGDSNGARLKPAFLFGSIASIGNIASNDVGAL